MEIHGFKCFDNNLINRYGTKFKLNTLYKVDGIIKFGNDGNGYHFCKRLEDTLRYFDGMNNIINICEVIGSGNITEYYDDYNEYYDMYASSEIILTKLLDRSDIINYALSLTDTRVIRFIMGFKLNDIEIELFKEKYKRYVNVLNYIDYYQLNDKLAFSKRK